MKEIMKNSWLEGIIVLLLVFISSSSPASELDLSSSNAEIPGRSRKHFFAHFLLTE